MQNLPYLNLVLYQLNLWTLHTNQPNTYDLEYRHVLVKPTNVSWKFTRYDDPNKDILISDMALLGGRKPIEICESGNHMAVIVEMILPASANANVALRFSNFFCRVSKRGIAKPIDFCNQYSQKKF